MAFLLEYGKYVGKTIKWVFDNDIKYFHKIEGTKQFKTFPKVVQKQYFKLKNAITLTKPISRDDEHVLDIINAFYNNEPLISIEQKLIDKGLSKQDSQELIRNSLVLERHNKAKEIENTVQLHIMRYDKIYNKVKNRNYEMVDDPHKRLRLELQQRMSLLEILLSKEKLIGFHNKKFKVKLNNIIKTKTLKEKLDIDFRLLTLEEKVRLSELYDKIYSPKIAEIVIKPKQHQIEDVEYEQVKEEVFESPIQEVVETNSSITEEAEPKTLHEVQKEIKKSLEEKIKEMYKKKSF